MNRRKFLIDSFSKFAYIPVFSLVTVEAKNEIDHYMEPAIIKEFGIIDLLEEGIEIDLPEHSFKDTGPIKITSNSYATPITIRSKLDAEIVALFADADSSGLHLIAKWLVPMNGIVDYFLKINLGDESGWKRVKVVIKDRNGMFYIKSDSVLVAIGKEHDGYDSEDDEE